MVTLVISHDNTNILVKSIKKLKSDGFYALNLMYEKVFFNE